MYLNVAATLLPLPFPSTFAVLSLIKGTIMWDLIFGEKCKGHLLKMRLGSPLSYNSPSEHNLGYCSL